MSRRTRIGSALALLTLALVAILAPIAAAADGEGLYGRTDDRVITFFCFGVIIFFALLVTVLSLIQIRGENRKDKAKQDVERLRQS